MAEIVNTQTDMEVTQEERDRIFPKNENLKLKDVNDLMIEHFNDASSKRFLK